MAAFLDNCRFNPTLGGTTDWAYSSAVAGYQSPSAANVVNGTKYKYFAIDASNNWELGEGAYNTSTGVLARTTILYSTNSNAKVSFPAAPQVAIVALKEDMISVEEANSFTLAQQRMAVLNLGVLADVLNVKSNIYGAKGDVLFFGDAAITSGSGAFASTAATFTAADVGKTINIAQAGTAGGTYTGTISAFTSAHAVTVTPTAGATVSAKSFEYGTDDTTAINSAIAAAGAKTVYLPTGNYFVKQLNATNILGLSIRGEGQQYTRLIANSAFNWATTAGHVLDLSGSSYVDLSYFSIGWQNSPGAATYAVALPSTGIFMSTPVSGASNLICGHNVRVTGQYSSAPVYNAGAVDSCMFEYCQFFNFRSGANSLCSALMFSSTNANALTSAFTTISSGTLGVSDWTLDQVEIHSFNNTTGQAVWFDGVTSIRVEGGNWSAGGAQYIKGTGTNTGWIFLGTTFQTESDPTTPTNLINQTSGTLVGLVDNPLTNVAGISGARYAGSITGYAGELVSSSVSSGSAVSLSTGTWANVTSIPLTAGKWIISGNAEYGISGSSTQVAATINTTSATPPTQPNGGAYANLILPAVGNGQALLTGTLHLDLSSSATVYLLAFCGFSSGAATAYGAIAARRVA